jgi:hypothetical protein
MESNTDRVLTALRAVKTKEDLVKVLDAPRLPIREIVTDWMHLRTVAEIHQDKKIAVRRDCPVVNLYLCCGRRTATAVEIFWNRGDLPGMTEVTIRRIVASARASGRARWWHPDAVGEYAPASAWGPVPAYFVYSGYSPSYRTQKIWVDDPDRVIREPNYTEAR